MVACPATTLPSAGRANEKVGAQTWRTTMTDANMAASHPPLVCGRADIPDTVLASLPEPMKTFSCREWRNHSISQVLVRKENSLFLRTAFEYLDKEHKS